MLDKDAWGKCVSKEKNAGEAGAYCHNHDQCYSGWCSCPDLAYDGDSCKDWRTRNTPSEQGKCSLEPVKSKNGFVCRYDDDCESWNCDGAKSDGSRVGVCTPKKDMGLPGEYCYRHDQCISDGYCLCPNYLYDGDYCAGWNDFGVVTHGKCMGPEPKERNGAACYANIDCLSGYCADGERCAPVDGTGKSGDYCHHNNHCQSKTCMCPGGRNFWGFCSDWKTLSFEKGETGTCF